MCTENVEDLVQYQARMGATAVKATLNNTQMQTKIGITSKQVSSIAMYSQSVIKPPWSWKIFTMKPSWSSSERGFNPLTFLWFWQFVNGYR